VAAELRYRVGGLALAGWLRRVGHCRRSVRRLPPGWRATLPGGSCVQLQATAPYRSIPPHGAPRGSLPAHGGSGRSTIDSWVIKSLW
jgi:hypothetical protein